MKTINKTPEAKMEGVIDQAFRECCYCLEWGGNTGECTKCLNSVQSQIFRLLCGWSREGEPLVV
jgi:hypothetical protein